MSFSLCSIPCSHGTHVAITGTLGQQPQAAGSTGRYPTTTTVACGARWWILGSTASIVGASALIRASS